MLRCFLFKGQVKIKYKDICVIFPWQHNGLIREKIYISRYLLSSPVIDQLKKDLKHAVYREINRSPQDNGIFPRPEIS